MSFTFLWFLTSYYICASSAYYRVFYCCFFPNNTFSIMLRKINTMNRTIEVHLYDSFRYCNLLHDEVNLTVLNESVIRFLINFYRSITVMCHCKQNFNTQYQISPLYVWL